MPPEKQPQNSAKRLLDLMVEVQKQFDGTVNKQDFEKLSSVLLESVKKIESKMTEKIAENKDISSSALQKMQADIASFITEIERTVVTLSKDVQAKTSEQLNTVVQQIQQEVKRIESLIPELPDYSDRFAEIESKIPVLPKEKLGEDYRNALEALPDGDKLAIEAIENLRKELDELQKMKAGGGNNLAFREFVTKFDLSPYLDGVTKTFNIPGTYAILSVACSSFPSVLRPTIDYTHTQSTITFTDEITADTTLAQGQTVIIMLINA